MAIKPKLSVVIVAYNEEKNLPGALKSAKFADEVLVIDGTSDDKTVEVARNAGAKIYTIPNDPLMKKMMNFGFGKAGGKWILSLDADERIPALLKEEILNVINGDFLPVCYRIPRKNLIFGKWIKHTGWYPDFQTRLFKKGQARFPEKNVHEELETTGEIGELKSVIEHLHYRTISEFISAKRLESYTNYEANKIIASGRKVTWVDALRFPFEEFLRRFFAWEGYRDGLHGLVLSLLMAFYWEVVFVKIWEKQKFPQYGDELFLDEVGNAFGKMAFEIRHWFMVKTKNPIKRVAIKLRNRLPF